MDKKPTILIVDDEANNLKLMQQILRENYELKFANNGKGALDGAKKHNPDLILLDIMMPVMDGYEVCRQLKNKPEVKNIPVIFVTAMDKEEDETRGFEFGVVDYISKPVRPGIVKARIKTHLSLKAAQDKIQTQNQLLKDQARKLFNFGKQKKAQVEKMGIEVTKAIEAITNEREDYTKSIVEILRVASNTKEPHQSIDFIKRIIETSIKTMKHLPSKKISFHVLKPGMISAQEIRDKNGRCLLTNGSMITEGNIERLIKQPSVKDILVIR